MNAAQVAGERPTAESRTFAVRSPVTGDLLDPHVAMNSDQAVELARRAAAAQKAWAATSYAERRAVLLRAADLLEVNLDQHATTLALEVGATRGWAEMNVHEAAATLREAAGMTSAPVGELLPSAVPGAVNHCLRNPAGVSLSIVPWNAPLVLAARSSAISLAVGNAVIVRPSELAPASAGHLLAGVLHQAGLDPDLFAVATTAREDGRAVIEALIDSAEIDRVVFIGSTPVGRSVAARSGAALTPAVLELGGKNATVLRADADVAAWVPQLAFSSFVNAGQVCMCTDRLFVHDSIYAETVERLAEFAAAMTVGDPTDPDTVIGPMINVAAARRFDELVADAVAQGARVVTGGSADGLYASPTVLTDVGTQCRFFAEEGFAPIVSVTPVNDDDHAVALANDTEFGLIASVIGADRHASLELAHRLRAGAVHVNGPSVGDEPHVPFGGMGMSGMGRLGGTASARFFTEERTFYVRA